MNGFKQSLANCLPVLLCFACFVAYEKFGRDNGIAPTATVDGAKLGRAYAPEVLATLADGWDAAADKLDAGATVAASQTALQTTWESRRQAAFAAAVQPEFARVLTEGVEPTAAQRPLVSKLYRDFAAGLRKGGK